MGDRQLNSYTIPAPDLAWENDTLERARPTQNGGVSGGVVQTLWELLTQHLCGTMGQVALHPRPVYLESTSAYYYPDLSVSDDPRDRQITPCGSPGVIQYPRLIIDVIPEGTLSGDSPQQFDHYRQIETLEEYVWLDPIHPKLNCFRQVEPGVWDRYRFKSGDDVYLDSLSFLIEIEAIYQPG